MKRHGLVLAAAAAFLGLGAAAAPGGLGVGAPAATIVTGMRQEQRRRQLQKRGWGGVTYRKTGPGWTHAQVQRMAAKKRNQARNRKAHRG